MTKLKKEAEEYALKQWEGNLPWSVIQKSYYDGALPREKRIAELEAQIENMKCCGNCEHATHDNMNGTFCNYYSEWEHADLKCTQWELRR